MNRDLKFAAASVVLLLPALILVSTGLLELKRPDALVHPVLVVGGLFLAFILNVWPVLRLGVGQDGDNLVATISLRVRGRAMNLTVLVVGCVLLATITAYLMVENFQPR